MLRLLVVALVLGVVACGGGGSSGGGGPTFTTVSAIEPGQTVRPPQGSALILLGDIDRARVKKLDRILLRRANLIAGFDADRELVSVSTGPFGVSLDSAASVVDRRIAPADPRFLLFVRQGNPLQRQAIMADPNTAGLEHVLFGAWLDPAFDIAFMEWSVVAAGVFGTFTPAAAVPVTGDARYEGSAVGYLVDAAGSVTNVSTEVTLNADFAARNVAFTSRAARDVEDGTLRPEFDTTATLTIQNERFNGNGTAANGWGATVEGRFFGPAADEAAGLFALFGAGVETLVTAFGAAR